MEIKTKICKSCNKEKPLSKFWKNSDSPDGVRGTCAECEKILRGSTSGRIEYEQIKSVPTRYEPENHPPGITIVLPGEPVQFYIETGIVPIMGRHHCLVCVKHDTLFGASLVHNQLVTPIAICNDCILKSEYGDIKYYKDNEGFFIVKRIGENK